MGGGCALNEYGTQGLDFAEFYRRSRDECLRRSGYDCSVEGSRGEAGGSLRLAAALTPASLDALVRGQFEVACRCAGSRVMAGRFPGYSGDARPLAVFV